ncbi:MAG: hypothetical protein WDO13_02860 [Verrucomicrobiota bacterium]
MIVFGLVFLALCLATSRGIQESTMPRVLKFSIPARSSKAVA